MASFTFNIAKGRVVELFKRVKANDPANSAIIAVPLAVGDSAANLQDIDTLALVLAGTPDEAGGSWGRKTLTDAELAALLPDDANDRFPAAIPQVTFVTPTAGQNCQGIVFCYDPDTTSGTDADLVPLTYHDFVVNADGNDVVILAGDIFRGS